MALTKPDPLAGFKRLNKEEQIADLCAKPNESKIAAILGLNYSASSDKTVMKGLRSQIQQDMSNEGVTSDTNFATNKALTLFDTRIKPLVLETLRSHLTGLDDDQENKLCWEFVKLIGGAMRRTTVGTPGSRSPAKKRPRSISQTQSDHSDAISLTAASITNFGDRVLSITSHRLPPEDQPVVIPLIYASNTDDQQTMNVKNLSFDKLIEVLVQNDAYKTEEDKILQCPLSEPDEPSRRLKNDSQFAGYCLIQHREGRDIGIAIAAIHEGK